MVQRPHHDQRCLVFAEYQGRTWTFELSQDTGPAWTHIGPWKLTHQEKSEPWLRELASQLKRSDKLEAEPEQCLQHALLQCGAAIRSCRWQSTSAALPPWPDAIRLGMPRFGALLPCDVERVGLEIGTRTLIKRDNLEDASLAARMSDWKEAGLERAEHGGVAFAAMSRSTVEQALHLEAILARAEQTASSELGRLLGYPECCIDAYLRVGAHDDRSFAEARDGQAGPVEAAFLIPALSLLSHVPCHAKCEPSRVLGGRLLLAIEQRSPGFLKLWLSVARGRWALDDQGVGWSRTDSYLYRFDPAAEDPCSFTTSYERVTNIIATMDHS